MTELNLDAMDLAELKKQADILGVTYAGNIGEDTLRKKISEVLGQTATDGEGQPDLSAPEPTANKKKDPNLERVTIIIHESESDKHPVFVGFNGRPFYMKRNEEVTVPQGVLNILDNAKTKVYNPKDTDKFRMVQRFPYEIVKK